MGAVDDLFGELVVPLLTDFFVDNPRTFTRTERNYDKTTGTAASVTTTAQIKSSAPFAAKKEEIGANVDQITILATDSFVVVPRKFLNGFDLHPTTGASVHVEIASVNYKVMAVDDYWSGDEIAAYRLLLRK